MNISLGRKLKAAVVAVAVLCVCTLTVYAAVALLTAEQAAEFLWPELAQAFRQPEAIEINKTQVDGAYNITLIGIAPGAGLTGVDIAAKDHIFAIVAVQKSDGSAMKEDAFGQFHPIPFIQGQKPWQGGVDSAGVVKIKDGVLYLFVDCEDLALFSDKAITLGVSDIFCFDEVSYTYHESTGLVTPNEEYAGVNVLFSLPIDASFAKGR
ncbi:MAG: hypothetical protein LBS36_13125 [Oscillospiraceae bacterium]|nr:hypothetical protein [Oscillospiraceae bacterium]